MFCTKCGAEIKDTDKFCQKCGNPVNNTKTPSMNSDMEKAVKAGQTRISSTQISKKNFKKKNVVAIIAIVIIISVGLVLGAFLHRNYSHKSKEVVQFEQETETSETDVKTEENTEVPESETEQNMGNTVSGIKELYNNEENQNLASDSGALYENDGGYILPESSTKYLTKADLEGLTADKCRLARNEIYARHGRIFKDEAIQKYFESKSWYVGSIEPDDFQESMLNEYELANRDLIVEYEKENGFR